jgi:hypothetical protein
MTAAAVPPLQASQAIRELGASLLGDALVVFPVRHHSPACAWHLRQLLAQVKPAAVLVEGPRGFDPFIPLLCDERARMPLAVYTYAVHARPGHDEPVRRASYYPFCEHSPELVALRAARAQQVPVRFIDLDYAEQCQLEAQDEGEGSDEHDHSLLDERHYRRSQHLQALARQLGCRDHEELWEHLFEIPAPSRSLLQHVTDLAAYCHLARSECSDAELAADGTLQREAEMRWHIAQALAARREGEGPVVAVVGGFHAVALPALLAREVPRPRIARGNVSDESSALIRYGDERLDRLNGYASGMTSPAWHRQLWERLLKHDKAGVAIGPRVRHEVALTVLFDIAHLLRERHGVALPMPALSAAYQQALQLARLRERAAPAREDVVDAVVSCFIKGEADSDGALVLQVLHEVLGGQAVGQVPPGASTPPLVRDFEHRARRQRLKIDDAQPRRAVLDLYRRPEHRVTSRLLHGLLLLGVPIGARTAGPDFVHGIGLDRLQEHWEYGYSAAAEAALVEASVHGVTVPLAVAQRFAARLDRLDAGAQARDARAGAALLVQACVLGLHDHLPRVLARLREAVGADAAFESVVDAAGTLGLLWESREPLEAREIEALPALLQAAYERALYLGRGLKGVPGDGRDLLSALSRLRELLASAAGASLDASLYWALLEALRLEHDAALVRGAATGLLYSAGRVDDAELGRTVDGHLNGGLAARDAVAFLRGLLHTAREAAWQQPQLLAVLDRLLQHWDEAAFVGALPELRLAFAEMTPKETDRIAEAVAQLHGAPGLGSLVQRDLTAGQVQAHLALSATVLSVLQADGLQAWVAS